ncbi:MAG: choice-of-anchor J domain-containing protein [Muribaculaceae bacterium]|nr:choice-of-anchor J domain-containing protein [Muribaculaceae bacterium]
MKHYLLTAGLLSATFGLCAAPQSPALQKVSAIDKLQVKNVKNSGKAATSLRLAPGVTLTKSHGIKKLHSIAAEKSEKLNLPARKATKAALPEGYVLYESFEDWDGTDYEWTPEGWSVEMNGTVDRTESWTPGAAAPGVPGPSDGDFYYGINFSTGEQDEWLISPYVTVGEGMSLSYWLYLDPIFLFNLDNVDWDTMSFIGEPKVSANLQIWAQAEGEEWTLLRDYFEEYKEYSIAELFNLTPTALEQHNVSLDGFYDKTTRVAFRYVGTDGNTMFIDAIGIGYPALEDISYMSPFDTLYWGFTCDWSLTGISGAIAQYPVYAPLTWTNMSYIDGAEFSWKYCDPVTSEFVESYDPDELTVTYIPDYRTEEAMRNNLFYPPTLNATAPNSTPGSYTAPYLYFQAGGKPEHTIGDNMELEFSLIPFNYHELGIGMTTVDDTNIGDFSIPVFGYNRNSDEYWLNYSLNGEPKEEGDYSHLIGIGNLFMPSAYAPIVIKGVNVYGFGLISDDAELKATIYGVDENMSTDCSTFEVIATTTIKGSDIMAQYYDSKGYLCLPFQFSEPVAVTATEEHPAYFIMLEGFNSDKVEYFAPLQSSVPDPDYICWGYMLNHIDLSNHVDRPAYYSLKPLVYKENDEYVDPYSAFAIGLDAEYPWLTTDCEGVNLPEDGSAVTVVLGSYYDGSQLTVEAPEGVIATVAGRYNKCELTVRLAEPGTAVTGNLVVKGPGVEVTIPVDSTLTGVEAIVNGNASVEGIYDLSGCRVETAKPAAGVYVIRYNDGTARKLVVK